MGKPKLLFYTHGLVDGGAERLWSCLASAMKSRGYDVIFAQDFEAPENRGNLEAAIPVTTLGRGHFGAVRKLAGLIRRETPDVALSAVGGSNLKLLLARALARSPMRTIISYHGFEEWRSGWLSYLTFKGLPVLSRMADRTISVSEGLGAALKSEWGAFAPRQQSILNPVFFPKTARVPTAAELAARPDVILSAGRLVGEKDFPTLLRAFAKLNRPNAKLIILGKGPERERLEAEVHRLGLEGRVAMPGYVSEPWDAYSSAKCFALSSKSEQFGNVIVEAMAHGLPAVATASVGPKEILDGGKHGRLVPIGDDVALAAALNDALDNPGNPAERRARAEAFSFDARVPAYEALIADVVDQSKTAKTRVYLDLTHLGRHVTGIERVSIEQFEKQSFRGADVQPVRSNGVFSMIWRQQVLMPLLALFNPRALFVFPGFPPSPLFLLARNRTLLYVHDLFLMTRKQDLSLKAKLYMAPPFRLAVKGLKYFMANSEKTRGELLEKTRRDASVALYRPVVRNVFALSAEGRAARSATPSPLRMVMVGTVEPRKNYAAAVAIRGKLADHGYPGAELHIVGREGWGDALAPLRADSKATLHGYLSLAEAKRIIEDADLYLCTSHDEGLGLPLIEAQFAGLPVVAPDIAVFREVLGASGLFIDPDDADGAARKIAAFMSGAGWRAETSRDAEDNAQRWNRLAEADAGRARGLFEHQLDETMGAAAPRTA